MMIVRAIMKTIFTGAAHGESEDGGGVAVAVAVVLEFACQVPMCGTLKIGLKKMVPPFPLD